MSEGLQSDKHPGYARHLIAVLAVVAMAFTALAAYHVSRKEAAEADKAGQPPVQVPIPPAQVPQQEPQSDSFVEELRKLREKPEKR